jgi:hypothetical protein
MTATWLSQQGGHYGPAHAYRTPSDRTAICGAHRLQSDALPDRGVSRCERCLAEVTA